MRQLQVLDLFSGIGGFSLGLERAGMKTVAFCEIEPYPRAVLAKHWPHVPCYDDVRTLTAERLATDGIVVDVICGGFPCQDISPAGPGKGIHGDRSRLWFEMLRLITEIRPRFVIIENVSALRGRGLEVVLGGLAALGYDAEWHCIPAASVGAPHRRDRIWIVAYPGGQGRREVVRRTHGDEGSNGSQDVFVFGGDGQKRDVAATNGAGRLRSGSPQSAQWFGQTVSAGRSENVADADLDTRFERGLGDASEGARRWDTDQSGVGADVADPDSSRWDGWTGKVDQPSGRRQSSDSSADGADADSTRLAVGQSERGDTRQKFTAVVRSDRWAVEPGICRVVDGVPARVDRLKGLGNAVVPQIPELIGHIILRLAKLDT